MKIYRFIITMVAIIIIIVLIVALYLHGFFSLKVQPWSLVIECPNQVELYTYNNKIVVCVKCKNIGSLPIRGGHMSFSGHIDNNKAYNGKLPGDIFDPDSEVMIEIPMDISNLTHGKHTITFFVRQNTFFTFPIKERTFFAQREFVIIVPDQSLPDLE